MQSRFQAIVAATLLAGAAPAILAQQAQPSMSSETAQAFAELEAIVAQCGSSPAQADTLRARYARFYAQVEVEIAGLDRLAQGTKDPAQKKSYSDRAAALRERLANLPKPDKLGCKSADSPAGTDAEAKPDGYQGVKYTPWPDDGICWSRLKITFVEGDAMDFSNDRAKASGSGDATPCPEDQVGADDALAELEAISAQCETTPTNADAQRERYRRFYTEVTTEIDGLHRLANASADPATRKSYADRATVLRDRLRKLSSPEELGCKADESNFGFDDPLARRLYYDPLWGTWEVSIERKRGDPSAGRVSIWPETELRCENKQGESCNYRWAVKSGGNYEVSGSATHMPGAHGAISNVAVGGAKISMVHNYFPKTDVSETVTLVPGGMSGTWQFDSDRSGRSTWRMQETRVSQIGLSDVTGEFIPTEARSFAPGEAMAVSGTYDAFNWSAQNSSRIRRPKIVVFLYGENMDGVHFVEFPKAHGFEPEMSRPIYLDGNQRQVIGSQITITLMPEATPGRKLMLVDGKEYTLDITIKGHPSKPWND